MKTINSELAKVLADMCIKNTGSKAEAKKMAEQIISKAQKRLG